MLRNAVRRGCTPRHAAPLAALLALAFIGQAPLSHAASPEIVGVVIDYAPRGKIGQNYAIAIERSSGATPVREHEIVYQGDAFKFDPAVDKSRAFVVVLVGSSTRPDDRVTIHPGEKLNVKHSWLELQTLAPQLVAAYRWINPAGGGDSAEPGNAISRGVQDDDGPAELLATVRGTLAISSQAGPPLWVGWTKGKPPFNVTVTAQGAPPVTRTVCQGTPPEACIREAVLGPLTESTVPLELTITTASGQTTRRTLVRKTIAAAKETAPLGSAGRLGQFLSATELLDRGHGELVLESARELSAIASDYPPARVMLDHVRDGRVP